MPRLEAWKRKQLWVAEGRKGWLEGNSEQKGGLEVRPVILHLSDTRGSEGRWGPWKS